MSFILILTILILGFTNVSCAQLERINTPYHLESIGDAVVGASSLTRTVTLVLPGVKDLFPSRLAGRVSTMFEDIHKATLRRELSAIDTGTKITRKKRFVVTGAIAIVGAGVLAATSLTSVIAASIAISKANEAQKETKNLGLHVKEHVTKTNEIIRVMANYSHEITDLSKRVNGIEENIGKLEDDMVLFSQLTAEYSIAMSMVIQEIRGLKRGYFPSLLVDPKDKEMIADWMDGNRYGIKADDLRVALESVDLVQMAVTMSIVIPLLKDSSVGQIYRVHQPGIAVSTIKSVTSIQTYRLPENVISLNGTYYQLEGTNYKVNGVSVYQDYFVVESCLNSLSSCANNTLSNPSYYMKNIKGGWLIRSNHRAFIRNKFDHSTRYLTNGVPYKIFLSDDEELIVDSMLVQNNKIITLVVAHDDIDFHNASNTPHHDVPVLPVPSPIDEYDYPELHQLPNSWIYLISFLTLGLVVMLAMVGGLLIKGKPSSIESKLHHLETGLEEISRQRDQLGFNELMSDDDF